LEVLDRPSAYIGMIGSRRRIRAVFQLLEEEKGIPRETFARVQAPVGLDIGGQTPAEIALSIMAEMVMVRRGGTGQPLSRER
ncbi:MAG: XdhC family protein, partial [Chloroflexota bacterium]